MDKLELNSLIERLIDSKGHDREAREAVAEFGRSIRSPKPIQIEGRYQKPGGTVSGQTEHGLVSMEDDRQQVKEFARGVAQERVGYYKVSRQDLKRKWDRILIDHFWKSDVPTQSETEIAQQWAIELDNDDQPLWFGERGIQHVRTFRCTSRLSLEVNREVFQESWPGTEAQHKGMLDFSFTIELPKFR